MILEYYSCDLYYGKSMALSWLFICCVVGKGMSKLGTNSRKHMTHGRGSIFQATISCEVRGVMLGWVDFRAGSRYTVP